MVAPPQGVIALEAEEECDEVLPANRIIVSLEPTTIAGAVSALNVARRRLAHGETMTVNCPSHVCDDANSAFAALSPSLVDETGRASRNGADCWTLRFRIPQPALRWRMWLCGETSDVVALFQEPSL